jgi:hypothetical protein
MVTLRRRGIPVLGSNRFLVLSLNRESELRRSRMARSSSLTPRVVQPNSPTTRRRERLTNGEES